MAKTIQMTTKEYETMANEFKALAEKLGADSNFLFRTTLDRYLRLTSNFRELEKAIDDNKGVLITKEYVKGRGNVYMHPAIAEMNKTAGTLNQTTITLVKILKELAVNADEKDELAEFLGKVD